MFQPGGVPEMVLTPASEVWLALIELWSALVVELDELAGERMFWVSLLKAEEDQTRNESLLNFYYI